MVWRLLEVGCVPGCYVEPFPSHPRASDRTAPVEGPGPAQENPQIGPLTPEVVQALSQALQLDDVERSHLQDLAAPSSQRRWAAPEVAQRPDPGMLRLMGVLEHVPVLLLGGVPRCWHVTVC